MAKESIHVQKCDYSNSDFQYLVSLLDAELTVIDGDEHDFYHQFNGISDIKYAIVLFKDENAVACGAIKTYDDDSAEIKRMYVLESARRKGYSIQVLGELEEWAKDLGFKNTILETGRRQLAAVSLYRKQGYSEIPNYGPYRLVENSICFKKEL